uniref:Uncharacterized protein n=1 Tax=Rhizophora mucronata TaxID=61149 RepID=A0A2P2NWR5_RHIMU
MHCMYIIFLLRFPLGARNYVHSAFIKTFNSFSEKKY